MCNELTRESFDRPFSFIKLFGRKQQIQLVAAIKHVFQSTSPTRGDDDLAEVLKFVDGISIHVPYERGRRPACAACSRRWYFNPRPLREGTTCSKPQNTRGCHKFQSTSPTRGDDPWMPSRLPQTANFNPRPLREGTTISIVKRTDIFKFQSTSPTRGDDSYVDLVLDRAIGFQSTSPTRGDDPWYWGCARLSAYFNPRPLREGTTMVSAYFRLTYSISIHVPYERGRPIIVSTKSHT